MSSGKIQLSLESIGNFKAWEGEFPLGRVTTIRGRNSVGKTVIQRALVAAFRPVVVPDLLARHWAVIDQNSLTLGAAQGEIRVRHAGMWRTVGFSEGGLQVSGSSDSRDEGRLPLMDAGVVFSWLLTGRGVDLQAVSGVNRGIFGKESKRARKLELGVIDAAEAEVIEMQLEESIGNVWELLAQFEKKWGAVKRYVGALVRYDQSQDVIVPPEIEELVAELRAEIRKVVSEQKIAHLAIGHLQTELARADRDDLAVYVCGCCGETVSIVDLRRLITEHMQVEAGAKTRRLNHQDELGRLLRKRADGMHYESVVSDVRHHMRLAGVKRSEPVREMSPEQRVLLLRRMSFPRPRRMVRERDLVLQRAVLEHISTLLSRDPWERVNYYIKRAKELRLTDIESVRSGNAVEYRHRGQWTARAESSDMAVVAVCITAACREVYESKSPVMIVDDLILRAEMMPLLKEVAESQQIAVVAAEPVMCDLCLVQS